MKDEILAYAQGEAYPFHMPGHKRNIKDGVFPYQLDLTEIDGFDNLHHRYYCAKLPHVGFSRG